MKKRPNSADEVESNPRIARKLELEAEALEPRVLFSGSPAPAEAPTEPEQEDPAPTADEAPATASAPAAEGSEGAFSGEDSEVTQDVEAGPLWAASNGDSEISEDQTVGIIGSDPEGEQLTQEILERLADAAAERWRATGLSDEQSNALDSISYSIVDLGETRLGMAQRLAITIDDDAAGNSWYIDLTPLQDEEYRALTNGNLNAIAGSDAAGDYDLLTVLFHEQGHVLGLHDLEGESTALMNEYLGEGERRLPVEGLADGSSPGSVVEPEFLTAKDDAGYATNEDAVLDVAAPGVLINDREVTLSNPTAVGLSDGNPVDTVAGVTVIGNTLTDGFAYNPLDPTATLPAMDYSRVDSFHAFEPVGETIIITYDIAEGVTLAAGEEFVFDLYGRSDYAAGFDRDNDFDVEFIGAGGVSLGMSAGLAIPDSGIQHLRVSTTDAGVGPGVAIEQIRITARNSSGEPRNFFGLQEVRAAVVGSVAEVISHDALSANGATVVVNTDGSFSFDPTGSLALQALDAGESIDDTFTYVVAGTEPIGERTATVTVTVQGLDEVIDANFSTDEDTALAGVLEDSQVLTLNNATAVRLSDGNPVNTIGGVTVIGNTLSDGFAYDAFDPTATLPALDYSTVNSFHANEPGGETIIISYDVAGGVTLAAGEELVFDLYGRDASYNRDNDFDVEFLSGGVSLGIATGLAIPDSGIQHLRVTSGDAGVAAGSTIDQIRIIARNSSGGGRNYFSLQEVRAAVLAPVTNIISSDALSANGATVVVNPDGTFSYDPRGLPVFQALNSGESVDDTFTYVVSGIAPLADRTATVTVTVNGAEGVIGTNFFTNEDTVLNEPPPSALQSFQALILNNATAVRLSDGGPALTINGNPIENTLTDGFAYDPSDPTATLPAMNYSTSDTFHAAEAPGETVVITYDINGGVTIAAGEEVMFDLYGRSDYAAGFNRDNDFDVEFLSGGVSLGIAAGLAIPDSGIQHLRVTTTDAGVVAGATIDQIRIIARDSDAAGTPNYFSLQEVRAAVLGSSATVVSYDAFSANGAVVVVNPDRSFSYDPTSAAALQALDAGESIDDTFSVVIDDGVSQSTTLITVTVAGVNDVPVTVADTGNATESGTTDFNVLANDTDVDVDDDPANFTLDSASIVSTAGLAGVSPAAAGTVTIENNQVRFDPGTDFEGLNSGQSATVVVNYTMSDDEGAQSSSTLTITVDGTSGVQSPTFSTTEDDVINPNASSGILSLLPAPTSQVLTLNNATAVGLTSGNPVNTIGGVTVIGNTLTDGFAYDPDNPTGTLPALNYSTVNSFHADEPGGETVIISYDVAGGVALATGDELVFDLYGRSDYAAGFDRDNDFDVEFLNGGISLGIATGLAIPDGGLQHLRVSTTDAGVAAGATIDQIRIIARNSSGEARNYFALQEVRAAVLGSATTVVSHDALSANGAVVSVNPDGSFTYDPTAAVALQALNPGDSVNDTFNVVVDDGSGPSNWAVTVTVNGLAEAAGNSAPVANTDSGNASESGTTDFDVLGNDTDVDAGDSPANFSLDSVSIVSTTGLTGVSPAPAGGVFISGNQVRFDPGTDFEQLNAGESATVLVNYTMSDDEGEPSSSTLTITVNGASEAQPPTFSTTANDVKTGGVLSQVFALNNATALRSSDGAPASSIGGGNSIVNTLSDGFAYDPLDPTGTLPAMNYSSSNTFHADESAGEAVVITYDIAGGVTLATGQALVFDIYGRNANVNRDNDFDVEFLNGGVSVGIASGLAIPDSGLQYLRVTTGDAGVAAGAMIDQIRIIARNSSGEAKNYFTLQEVRTAVLEPGTTVVSHDALSTNGAVVVVNPDGSFTYDPNGAAALVALDAGDSVDDTFDVLIDDGSGQSTRTVTVTVAGVNDAPVAVADAGNATENGTTDFDVLADDTDVDGDDAPANFTLDSVSIDSTAGLSSSPAAAGSVSIVGNMLRFDPGTDFDELLVGETATVLVNYTMSDDEGATSSTTLTITVNGAYDAPVMGVDAFELSTLDGSDGFVLYGVDAGDHSGRSVSNAGDVNGDGIDDLIIGALDADGVANGSALTGESYVVFGKASGWGSSLELSSLNGSNGFVIYGEDSGDESGISVSGAGDVNGDGIDDLLIGARNADGATNGTADAGGAYVVFGKASAWSSSLELSALNGSDGFALHGLDAGDRSGWFVSSAGDMNGDGFDDVLISAYTANGTAGETYVVFGKAGAWSADVEFSSLDGSNGFVMYGVGSGDRSGESVSSAGDVNGDGFDDLLVGSMEADPNGGSSGETYVVFGKASGWGASLSLNTLNGSDGFVLNGINGGDQSGVSVSSAGDVNGDGFADILIGARGADGQANGYAGAGDSYVVFGKASGWGASINLSSLDGSNGFVLHGVDPGDQSGRAVSSAGDVNGDGLDDLLIGAKFGESIGNVAADTGEAYVIFGKTSAWSAAVNLIDLDGSDGFVLYGVDAGDLSGLAVSSAGDVNGDGFDDLLIGAKDADGSGNSLSDAGESYVFFGRDFANQIDGSGSVGADYLVGSALDDTLAGLGGADAISSGAGDDILGVSDLNFSRVDGGNGEDTLRLDGSNLDLDLMTIPETRLQDLEVIDLNGNSNTLILSKIEVLNLSTHSNTLRVMGGAGNGVTAEAGWTAAGTQVVDAVTYDVFTQDEATLLVQQGGMTFFPASFELSALDGINGFVLNGIDVDDFSGFPVSNAGDVNGDGFDDLLVGAYNADPNGKSRAGETYVVFGKGDWSANGGVVELSALDGINGFVLNGIDGSDQSGRAVSSAGDVNGDGIDDLLVGARFADPNGNSNAGESYVVFGKGDWSASAGVMELSSLDGSNGFVLNGIDAGDQSGWSGAASGAGDVNGDGFADLLVGAYRADPNGSSSGESYVVFGKADWSANAGVVELSALDGTNGFVINGVDAGDWSGFSVSDAGDVNGDGFDDLIIGAYRADPNGDSEAGESYVVFGKSDWSASAGVVELSALDGSNGFVLNGIDAGDWSGQIVSNAGDVNGDGFADLLVGAATAEPKGLNRAGESYVVFGKGDWSASAGVVELSALDGSNGFVLNGINEGDISGRFLSSAGDVNGDGFDDLLVGAPGGDENAAGESYVVFGKGDWSTSAGIVEFSDLDGINGIVLIGVDGEDRSGFSVSSAGDVNGDGFDDIMVGALWADPNGKSKAGESYVFFGRDFTNQIDGSGSVGADYLVGSALDDTLVGLGGADVLSSGAGDDILGVSDLNFSRIDGGNGEDTLRLDGSNLDLDLTTILDTRLQDLEVIDLNGNGNTLMLSKIEVLNLSTHSNTLRVMGGVGNGVTVEAGWTASGTQVVDTTTYDVYTQNEATLLLQQGGMTLIQPLSSYELSALNGSDGFVLNGIDEDDGSGRSVSSAGDVNGDGYDDLLVGAHGADPNGNSSGESYVVFGAGDWSASAGVVELSALDGSNGFVLNGVGAEDQAGYSVSSAGDVNGDGFDDLLIGANNADPNGDSFAGESYVVFGKGDWSASGGVVELSALDGNNGFVLNGIDLLDRSGHSVSSAGDVNGDGFDDLLVGAQGADPNGDSYAGESYVVFGKGDWSASVGVVELSSLDGSNGFVLNGINADDRTGWSVSSAGDVNGDGFDDLLMGAYRADPNGLSNAGASYVVFGKGDWSANGGVVELSSLDGSNGFVLNGIDATDRSGRSVSNAGDVNGDGFDDLIVGAIGAAPSGSSYIVFGKSDWSASAGVVDLSSLDGNNGFLLNGVGAGLSSYSVSSAGDVNGDGFDDLLVGDNNADPNGISSGESYVVFGKGDWSASAGVVELSSLDGSNGFALKGIDASDFSGEIVSSAGDVNGDGFDDLLIGARRADPNGDSNAGESYVFFGRDFTNQIDASGSVAADYLVGSASDDTLVGLGGADAISGGAGDDVLAVSDLSFNRIDGGNGEDTLRLDGSNLDLDLSTIPDTRLQNLERIDLNGNNNTLTLNILELLNLSTDSNTLLVMGGAGNVVTASGTWAAAGTQVVDSVTYDVYTQGEATLLIQQGGMTFITI